MRFDSAPDFIKKSSHREMTAGLSILGDQYMSFRTLGMSLILLSVLLPGMSALAVEENASLADASKHCSSSELGDSSKQQALENIQIAQGDGVVQTTPVQEGQPARSYGDKPTINEPLSAGCGSCQFGNDTGKVVWGICIPCN